MQFPATSAQARTVLGISETTMVKLRREGIFRPGIHYRCVGLGRRRPRLRWNVEAAEKALAGATRKILATSA